MAKIEVLGAILRKLEGGYSTHPKDKGGPTNMGVTLTAYKQMFGRDKTAFDLKNMNDRQWNLIFRRYYWNRCMGDFIESQSVANIFIDWYFNSGYWAIKHIQRIVGTDDDGIMGNMTLNAINSRDPEELFNAIKEDRKNFFENIVKNDKSQSVFLKGWMNRLKSYNFTD